MFGLVLTTAVTIMHVYVFWRAGSVPFLKNRIPRKYIYGTGMVFWILFYLGREIGHGGTGIVSVILELFGMNWMAVLFLMSVTVLMADIITIFGLLLPGKAPSLRGQALAVGCIISLTAIIQGMRPPVIENYDVYLSGLPDNMDGKVIIAMSDLHLGSVLGKDWLSARIDQVEAQHPDMIVLLGDIIEGHGRYEDEILSEFRQLSAPFGVWAVLGNHDSYRRNNSGIASLNTAGIQLLRNSWTEIMPGFILAGVDNLSGRRLYTAGEDPISRTLKSRPQGTTIFLSHKPLYAERVAKAGVGLMLCGHTHGGQIWPFDYIVKRDYPLLEGQYEVDGMSVIVCRGTGIWGPRMRLWSPSEISRITLHVK